MVRTASDQEHPELLWAARGGGRGLGVVTSFELDLHPLGPEVATALLLYAYQDAERLLRAWPEVNAVVPDEVTPELALWSVPPDPAFPESLHGSKAVVVSGVYAGAPADAGAALAPLRRLGTPLADLSATVPYVELQRSLDAAFPDGGRYYMLSHFMDELPHGAIQAMLDWDTRRPTPESLMVIRTLGGAVARAGAEHGAYAHRSARFNISIDAAWSDPALDDSAIGWARNAWAAIRPFSGGGVYVNFAGLGDETDSLRGAVLGANQQRLERIRRAYDPDGLFEAAARRP
jgi:FAD/FMN-containing dehydrogenase